MASRHAGITNSNAHMVHREALQERRAQPGPPHASGPGKAVKLELKGEAPFFAEERPGWKGYVEWEKYPEKKRQAAEILKQYQFDNVSFQMDVWR